MAALRAAARLRHLVELKRSEEAAMRLNVEYEVCRCGRGGMCVRLSLRAGTNVRWYVRVHACVGVWACGCTRWWGGHL